MKRFLTLCLALMLVLSVSGGATADGSAAGFTLTPILWDGAALGKIAVPDGFVLESVVNCSDDTTCLGSPLRITAMVSSQSERAIMGYYANETYIDRVVDNSVLRHVDGELDKQTMIFMLRYMNADQYCDARAGTLNAGASYYASEDMSYFNSRLDAHKKLYSDVIIPGLAQYGLNADWLEITAAQRVYTYEANGETWAICLMAEVRGYQYSLKGTKDVCALWDVPGFYMLVCPMSSYRTLHDSLFETFVQNTEVSDTFYNLQDQLTEQIRDQTIKAWSMQVAASNAYAAAMNAFTSASVESYLQQSAYSSVDRFTDYIFDRNTYTTSDGYDVSISTAYDYVWEGSGGTVYYSGSAFDMPYGAVQLSPR